MGINENLLENQMNTVVEQCTKDVPLNYVCITVANYQPCSNSIFNEKKFTQTIQVYKQLHV